MLGILTMLRFFLPSSVTLVRIIAARLNVTIVILAKCVTMRRRFVSPTRVRASGTASTHKGKHVWTNSTFVRREKRSADGDASSLLHQKHNNIASKLIG